MADIAALTDLIAPLVRAQGLALVRVAMLGGVSDPTLQVMAERPDTRQLTIDDCATLSRAISDKLDALEAEGRDPVEGAYRLEVSSPGIDRPLTRPKDYSDWAGHEARLRLEEPIQGRKQIDGVLVGIVDEAARISVPKLGELQVPLAAIRSAKLLLTDKLIAATAPLSADGADTIKQEG
ncbi:MAG: ribosome maturation protein RimP [Alphaproteobacteria bacterium]|nr:ribosome maturation protein RimP [Alphaproteobacteria bacterium]